ncbi:galactose mutarotase-like protein [Amylostereum chailletii]|nr:galactose mutarotase-like protein [Amylostereum chailletii]
MPVQQLQDRIILQHSKGSSAEILLYGATIISWKSADSTSPDLLERLFVSSKAALDGSKPVRGGIPVVFPQHGFARNEVWNFDSVVMDAAAAVSVKLTLAPRPSIAAVYSQDFELEYVVTLAEHQLSADLHIANPSQTSTLEFQALLHTYIRAPAQDVAITPLTGKNFLDKTQSSPDARHKQENRTVVDVKQFTDAVYEDAPNTIHVAWPGGGLVLKMAGFKNVTIWNPQADAGRKIGDMEDEGWEHFVCVEPGYVLGFKELAPSQRWIGHQVLSVL